MQVHVHVYAHQYANVPMHIPRMCVNAFVHATDVHAHANVYEKVHVTCALDMGI